MRSLSTPVNGSCCSRMIDSLSSIYWSKKLFSRMQFFLNSWTSSCYSVISYKLKTSAPHPHNSSSADRVKNIIKSHHRITSPTFSPWIEFQTRPNHALRRQQLQPNCECPPQHQARFTHSFDCPVKFVGWYGLSSLMSNSAGFMYSGSAGERM